MPKPHLLTAALLLCAHAACHQAPAPAPPPEPPRTVSAAQLWVDPAGHHMAPRCSIDPHHPRRRDDRPFDEREAAQALARADRAIAKHVEDLRQSAECYSADNGFIICVTRATSPFGGLIFGTREALYHRHPASSARDGATRLYGLHDPQPQPLKRPYSDCMLNPEYEPASQGCLSINEGDAALQCGDALIALTKLDPPALADLIDDIPIRFPPLRHTIVQLAQHPEGVIVYSDRITAPAAYRDGYLDLIFDYKRLAIGSYDRMIWVDPRLSCELCDVADNVEIDDVDLWRAALPDLHIGWPEHEYVLWSGECEVFRSLQ